MKCVDKNGTSLNVGDDVMCVANGDENEAIIVELLPENKVKIDGENGIIDVDASDCFYLPHFYVP